MNDTKHTLFQELAEKKKTAASARYRKVRGGRVRFISDYLTQKERETMNGEVFSYRLNEPMKWEEYRGMPDDLKLSYLQSLRDKFDVANTHIAAMFGVCSKTVDREAARLGISMGRGYRPRNFLAGAWRDFCEMKSIQAEQISENADRVQQTPDNARAPEMTVELRSVPQTKIVPHSGSLTFNGNATEALAAVAKMLGDAVLKINIQWGESEGADDGGR